MSRKNSRKLTPQLKSKVGLAALKGEATILELAARHEVHRKHPARTAVHLA